MASPSADHRAIILPSREGTHLYGSPQTWERLPSSPPDATSRAVKPLAAFAITSHAPSGESSTTEPAPDRKTRFPPTSHTAAFSSPATPSASSGPKTIERTLLVSSLRVILVAATSQISTPPYRSVATMFPDFESAIASVE